VQRWQLSLQREVLRERWWTCVRGNRGTRLNRKFPRRDDARHGIDYNALPNQYLSGRRCGTRQRIDSLNAQVANPFYRLPNMGGHSRTRPPSPANAAAALPAVRQILISAFDGYSWYHSLQAKVERRYTPADHEPGLHLSKFMEACCG